MHTDERLVLSFDAHVIMYVRPDEIDVLRVTTALIHDVEDPVDLSVITNPLKHWDMAIYRTGKVVFSGTDPGRRLESGG